MTKPFVPPQLQKVEPAVPQEKVEEGANKQVVVQNAPTKPVKNDLFTIYKNQIDNFKDFIAGKYKHNNEQERSKAQIEFINLMNNILNAKPDVFNKSIRYLVETIRKNPQVFRHERLFAPYWAMKKRPNVEQVKPYIAFVEFIVSFANNIQRKPAFLKGYDVAKLCNMFNAKQAENLQRYLFD